MKLLLDTHAFLWFVLDEPRLSKRARELLEDIENEVLFSPASHWEIAIKVSTGKLKLREPLESLLPREIEENEFAILPIEIAHSALIATLPFHHRDPFDRMLIAQAIVEEIPILSADAEFDAYHPLTRLW